MGRALASFFSFGESKVLGSRELPGFSFGPLLFAKVLLFKEGLGLLVHAVVHGWQLAKGPLQEADRTWFGSAVMGKARGKWQKAMACRVRRRDG